MAVPTFWAETMERSSETRLPAVIKGTILKLAAGFPQQEKSTRNKLMVKLTDEARQ